MKKLLMAYAVGVALLAVRVNGQTSPIDNTNAALRYWMAFAEMKDPVDGKAGLTNELIDRVASGAAPWDEAKFGRILDENAEALAIMQRATYLRFCDWGLEYELGSTTPIAHLAKG